jgi:hypothetical protein
LSRDTSRIRHFRDGYFNLPDQRPQWTRYVIQQQKLITDMMAFNGTRIGFNLVFPNPPCAGSWLDAAKNPPSAIAVWLPMANLDSFESLNEYNFQTPHCGNNSWAALLHQYQIDFYNACKSFAPPGRVEKPEENSLPMCMDGHLHAQLNRVIVRDQLVWDKSILLQQLAHEVQRGTLVPPALDQHIKHFALGIHGAGDFQIDLIQMPGRVGLGSTFA